jgi:3-dehydroquinate dehydratase-2
MNILIINGPNLNLLGKRQTDIYGTRSFDEYIEELKQLFPQHTIEYYQSNHEGAIIDRLHSDGFTADAIILNAGAYTHTSIAIADAIRSISTPVIEVHISNIYAREDYRRISYIANACRGSILGFGLDTYRLAIEAATHL